MAATPYPKDRFTIDASVALGVEVTLVAQSKVLTGDVVGAEVLSRDRMTREGVGALINDAEHTRTLGDFVHDTIEAAARAVDELVAAKAAVLLAVNMPPHELTNYTVRRCAEVAQVYPYCMPYLELEITEREPLLAEHVPFLRVLHDMGYHLTLDDFGTTHAHFDLLARLPELELLVDTIKIDREPDTNDVAGMVAELQARGYSVVVEGVEDLTMHGAHIEGCITQGYAHGEAPTLAQFVDSRL